MIGEEKIGELAKLHGTPLYIFDKEELYKRIGDIQKMLGEDITLCYAMKANPFLVDALKPLVPKFEVCSPGEFAICRRENVDMSCIVLSGVYKKQSDIEYVMDECGGVGVYTVESMEQFNILCCCAKIREITIAVLLRLTSKNQFGLDELEIEQIIENRADYPYIDILGIQYYSGTQKKKVEVNIKELQQLDTFCKQLKNKYDFTVKELEYGPGLMVSYFGEDAYKNDYKMLQEFLTALEEVKKNYHITLEMGRYLVATCGIYVSKVVDIKVHSEQQYCIIDGGINHINYYGQTMAMKIPAYAYLKNDGTIVKAYGLLKKDSVNIETLHINNNKSSNDIETLNTDEKNLNIDCKISNLDDENLSIDSKTSNTDDENLSIDCKTLNVDDKKCIIDNEKLKWTICGSLCTVADVIVKNLPIGQPDKEDLLFFYNIGAYSVTEGIYLFLSRTLPKIITYDKNGIVEVLRDFYDSDIINSRKFVLNK